MSKIPVKELSRILSEANGDVCLYVEDCQTGEVYTVNGEKKVQSASTIKVPILAMLLKAAQERPEEYLNLSVRVSGWNARFVTLNREWQDMIIAQTGSEF